MPLVNAQNRAAQLKQAQLKQAQLKQVRHKEVGLSQVRKKSLRNLPTHWIGYLAALLALGAFAAYSQPAGQFPPARTIPPMDPSHQVEIQSQQADQQKDRQGGRAQAGLAPIARLGFEEGPIHHGDLG